MTTHQPESDVLFEELTLTLDQLARACGRDPDWVIARVESGVLDALKEDNSVWKFTSIALIRARRLASIESSFETDQDTAALVVDLIEENARLRRRLKLAGLD